MAAVSICSDFGAHENQVYNYYHCFPIYLPEVMRVYAMIFVFWKLSFKSTFSLSSFTFIKRLFRSSLRSPHHEGGVIRVSEVIDISPGSPDSSLQFIQHSMTYSACKLDKQGDNIQPWHTPLPIWNQSVGPWPVLTVASWPAYRFLKRQVRWSGIPIFFTIFDSLWWSTQSKALV